MTEKPCCSLNEEEHVARRQLVRETLLDHIEAIEEIDGGIRLSFAEKTEPDLEHFVELERDCCSFLTFAISAESGSVYLSISGPAEAASTIDRFRQGFKAGLTAA